MPYADRAALQLAIGGADRLTQAADYDGDGAADDDVIDDALAFADGLVNSYVRRAGRETPLASPPFVIVKVAAGLAAYDLKAQRGMVTDGDQLRQEQRLEWLKSLVEGKVDLGVSPAPPASARNQPSATDRGEDKAVSRAKLRGFA